MSNIRASCIGQTMRFTNTPTISSGDVNYDTITFDFCGQWDNFVKTAIFYRDENDVYYQLLDENNTCIIPKEVLTDKGTIYLGVFGVKNNVTLTSQVLNYKIIKGAITENLKPSDPTPDIYAQLIDLYDQIRENEADFIKSQAQIMTTFREEINKGQTLFIENQNQTMSDFQEMITDQQTDFINSQNQTMSDYHTEWTETVETTRQEMIDEVNQIIEESNTGNAQTLNGHEASYFATAKSVSDIIDGTTKVSKASSADNATNATNSTNATNASNASNSNNLNNQPASYYATASSVTNIINGTTKVSKATSADSATSATKATQDSNGAVIANTYHKKASGSLVKITADGTTAPTDTTVLWAY